MTEPRTESNESPAAGPPPRAGGAVERDPRVYLAGERTLLAWVRTGLAMMGFGFVVARFGLFLRELAFSPGAVSAEALRPGRGRMSLWVGTVLVLLGVAVHVVSAAQHARFLRRFRRGEPLEPPTYSLGVGLSLVLAAVGLAMAAYLVMVR